MAYPFPFGCYTFNPKGQAFLINTRIMVLQYVVVRPLTTILSFALDSADKLCPLSMSPQYGGFWVVTINMISVTVAMVSYHFLKEQIHFST